MLYSAPPLDRRELDVIARIDAIRAQVRFVSDDPRAWSQLVAPLFVSDADGREDAGTTTAEDPAFAGYCRTLQYILSLHDDPHFVYHEMLLRSLHYISMSHDPEKRPGRWRGRTICVYGRGGTEVLYQPPPAELVPELARELMAWLNGEDNLPPVVRAAIAHLNLVQIHPFLDGNGRLGRALHTLVMVRAGILEPEFASIEKSVARDRDRYRDSLYELGTAWEPSGKTRPFVRYCLAVHLDQAERALREARQMTAAWAEAAAAVTERRLPERVTHAIADAAFSDRVDAAAYRQWARITDRRARADLRRLADLGFLVRQPGHRASYAAGPETRKIREGVRAAELPHHPIDPFA